MKCQIFFVKFKRAIIKLAAGLDNLNFDFPSIQHKTENILKARIK